MHEPILVSVLDFIGKNIYAKVWFYWLEKYLCLAAVSSYANPSAGAARPTEAQQTFLSHVSM